MKVLLDHCMPRRFARLLEPHDVVHTSHLGWGNLKNGNLLSAAEAAGFDAMITVDRGIQHQQKMGERRLSLVFLRTPGNDAVTLAPLAPLVLSSLVNLQSGEILTISHPIWS